MIFHYEVFHIKSGWMKYILTTNIFIGTICLGIFSFVLQKGIISASSFVLKFLLRLLWFRVKCVSWTDSIVWGSVILLLSMRQELASLGWNSYRGVSTSTKNKRQWNSGIFPWQIYQYTFIHVFFSLTSNLKMSSIEAMKMWV